MIYPNPAGEGRPLPCLRLKLLKKGIDDFEYLTILTQRLEDQARERGEADPASVARTRVREITSEVVRDIGKYNLDAGELERLRRRVAEEIEGAQPPR